MNKEILDAVEALLKAHEGDIRYKCFDCGEKMGVEPVCFEKGLDSPWAVTKYAWPALEGWVTTAEMFSGSGVAVQRKAFCPNCRGKHGL